MADFCRTVNLEEGMPASDAAVRRLTYEIQASRRLGAAVLKIIHGYGSSGTGGKIRTRSRGYLDGLARRGQIKAYIPGEQFSIFDAKTRDAFAACPSLRQDRDLDKFNNGVTFILL